MEGSLKKIPPILAQFIDDVTRVAAEEPDRARAIERIEPRFAELLADRTFLAEAYQQVIPGNSLSTRSTVRRTGPSRL